MEGADEDNGSRKAAAGGPQGDPPARKVRRPLSTRLLIVTALAVMIAEILIFVPSIAKFRLDWLEAKIETAAVAGLASERTGSDAATVLSERQQRNLLKALDARLIAVINEGASRLIARTEALETIDLLAKPAEDSALRLVSSAFNTLFFGSDRLLRISGPVGDGTVIGEVVVSEAPLRRAMLVYSRNILVISLIIAIFVALLVYLAIRKALIRPIEAMTHSMVEFAEKPTDSSRIIVPSARKDEIGVAEAELARMQERLARTFREQRHLADLGLAVSKINHDLRNILASAHMVSDRLSSVADPRVQRVVPMLLRSLDRALAYTQSVLNYGKAVESAPVRRRILLHGLIDDVFGVLNLDETSRIECVNEADARLEVTIDPDQFHRVLLNLARNAAQALQDDDETFASLVRRIRIGASATEVEDEVLIYIEDTGPGMPARAREHLFTAFAGSARSGGTGLGLAIVAEIVEAHGGRIELVGNPPPGTRFEIRLPDALGDVARRDAGTRLRAIGGRDAEPARHESP